MATSRQPGNAGPSYGAEQLRADIDTGRTGDKVAYPDPAAVPLGADDETDAQSTRQKASEPAQARPSTQAEARKGTPSGNPETRSRSWLYIAGGIALLVILLLLGTLMPYQPQ